MRVSWALLLLSCAASPLVAQPANRPNFVILLVDDWGWSDASYLGSDLYVTPNIDQLAADGMRFTTSYSACTVCSPTRAAMMTGQYPGRTNVTDFIRGGSYPHEKLLPPDWTMALEHRHKSLAEALLGTGYRTAMVVKWHLEPRGDPDEDEYIPERHGFEINVAGNEWGAPPSYHYPYKNDRSPRAMGPLEDSGNEEEYLTDRLTDEALNILDGWGDQPFFLYFPYYTVHTPIEAKDEDAAPFGSRAAETLRHTDAEYAGMLAALDRSVGRVRQKLDELGVADNTVIILTGDNGGLDRNGSGRPTENHPLREGKGSAYEGGVRVPSTIYWPGVTKAGSSSGVSVVTVDYCPTVLDIAGVEPAAKHIIDGVSLTPLLREPSTNLQRLEIYWHYPHYHGGGADPHSAIRDGDWRLVHFYSDDRVELYNLADDIGESTDLSEDMPDKADQLLSKLEAWRTEVSAQHPVENPNFAPALAKR